MPFRDKIIAGAATLFTFVTGMLIFINPYWWMRPYLNPHHSYRIRWGMKTRMLFKLDVVYQNIFHKVNKGIRKLWLREIELNYASSQRVGKVQPLAEFDYNNLSLEEFDTEYRKKQRPVVLRNFLAQDSDYKEWDYEGFLKTYGDEVVNLTCPVKDGYHGRLKEINIPGVYLHNSETLLKRHPHLLKQSGFAAIKDKLAKGLFFTGLAQLFVGRKKMGTWWHCAGGINFFLMLSGQKKWTFMDPNNTPLLIPRSVGEGSSAYYIAESGFSSNAYQSFYKELSEEDQKSLVSNLSLPQEKLESLYQACDRYEVVLNPGDVLLSPAWYWHDVENITETSIGMATRWLDPKRPPISNQLFDLGTRINPKFFYTAVMSVLKQKRFAQKKAEERTEEDFKEYGAHFTRASDFSQLGEIHEGVKAYYKRVGHPPNTA